MRPASAVPALSALAALALLAPAQIADRATLAGTVSDASGARIPQAKLTLSNEATGVKTVTATNADGYYTIPYLPVGLYELTVEAPGFRTTVSRGIALGVRAFVTQDVTLEVGAVTDQVSVDARAPLLNMVNAEVSTSMDNRLYSSLPLSLGLGGRRDPEAFMQLVPGVSGQRINGGAQWSKEIEIGGAPVASAELQGDNRNMTLGASVEAIEEFRIATSNSSADLGRGQGMLSFTYKSGTNDLHGSVYEYLRNNEFDARGFFQPFPSVNRINNYGFTVGGPVLIPKLYNGRNRTFFFFNYDAFKSRAGASNSLITLPSERQKAGDFTGRNPIYDPKTTTADGTRSPFPGNMIPANRISAVTRNILSLIPAPNLPGIVNNYQALRDPSKRDSGNYTIKIDHTLTGRQHLSVSWNRGTLDQLNAHTNPTGVPGPLASDRNFKNQAAMGRISHDLTISSTLINHFSFGFNRFPQDTNSNTFGQPWPDKLGLRGVPIPDFPEINFATDSYATFHRSAETGVFFARPNSFIYTDQISWIRGKHNLKFGADLRWLQNNFGFQSSSGPFTFSRLETGQPTAPSGTTAGDAFASFLLGAVDNGSINLRSFGVTGDRWKYMAYYVADDFRITPRLTVNVGLRYEIPFGHTEVNNVLSSFDPGLPNPGAGGRLGALAFASPSRRRFSDVDKNEFGPRIGLAYSTGRNMVIRSGYGLTYIAGGDLGGNAQRGIATGWSAAPSFRTQDTGRTPGFYWDDGFPQNFKYPPLLDPSVANNGGISWIRREGGRAPYYQQWNFTLERTFGSNLLLSSAYVGGKGTRLVSGTTNWNQVDPRYLSLGTLLNANIASADARAAGIALPYPGFTGSVAQALRPFPQYSNIGDLSPLVGNSTYHSLQAKAEKRLSHGVQFLVGYTWSKTLEDAVSVLSGVSARDSYNRRLEKAVSDSNPPHRFVTSFSYDLPLGAGKTLLNRGIAARIFGDWSIAGILTYQRNTPLTIGVTNTIPLFNSTNLADRISGQDPRSGTPLGNFNVLGGDVYINKAAFAVPGQFRFGNGPRTVQGLRQPATYNEDLTLVKIFKIRESISVQLRGEAYNLLNRVRLGGFGTNLQNADFGRISAQANSPRTMQLNAKIVF